MKVVLEIAGNAVIDGRDNQKRTPLVLATMGGHGEVVNYLLSQGGSIAISFVLDLQVWPKHNHWARFVWWFSVGSFFSDTQLTCPALISTVLQRGTTLVVVSCTTACSSLRLTSGSARATVGKKST